MYDRRISRAFVSMIVMFCLFLFAVYYCLCERIKSLEFKIDEYSASCDALAENISKLQEADRRILEQNAVLFTELRLQDELE